MDKPLGADRAEAETLRPSLWPKLLILALLALLAAVILVPNFLHAKSSGQLTACKSNLKNLATACEMYAADNRGCYPESLQQLLTAPDARGPYLRTLPTCPTALGMTYTDYHCDEKHKAFSFGCCGNHHRSLGKDHPRFDSQKGLIVKPDQP